MAVNLWKTGLLAFLSIFEVASAASGEASDVESKPRMMRSRKSSTIQVSAEGDVSLAGDSGVDLNLKPRTIRTRKPLSIEVSAHGDVSLAEASELARKSKAQITNTLMRGDDVVGTDKHDAVKKLTRSTGITLPLPHFQVISSGTCADIGLRDIRDQGECVGAYRTLTSDNLRIANRRTYSGRPSGCVFYEKKGEPKLIVNTGKLGVRASDTNRVYCSRAFGQDGKVPTCAEELLVRYKASRMLKVRSAKGIDIWEKIGAWDENSVIWTKYGKPIVMGPALVRMVFHDYVDHHNLASTGSMHFSGGFDGCMHAPKKSDDKNGFDTDMVDVQVSHNSGLLNALKMIRALVKDTTISLPDGIVLATAAYLEGETGLKNKIEMKFGRQEANCDAQGGNQFGKKSKKGQVYLQAAPTKFDEPQQNLDFFKHVLGLTAREMVALYGAHTLGGLNNGVIPYGSMGGPREAPFCANRKKGGKRIPKRVKRDMHLDHNRSVTKASALADVWFDQTPGTFDNKYFKQMIDEWDLYADVGQYAITGIWAENMNATWKGAHGIARDFNNNPDVGPGYYAAPAFPLCGQSGPTLLGIANKHCKDELGIPQETMDTTPWSCPRWEDACEAGRWCRHIPLVNDPSQANVKSLTKWTEFGERKGRVATLPSDWGLLMIEETRQHVREFVEKPDEFHQAFADVFKKMVDSGEHTGLQQCSPVQCDAETDGFSCNGLDLKDCDSPPEGSSCQLVGAFGFEGEVSCGEKLFRCSIDAGDEWDAALPTN